MCTSIIKENTAIEIIVIIILLVTAAKIMANDTSTADNGAYSISTILPCILPIIKELTEWLKDGHELHQDQMNQLFHQNDHAFYQEDKCQNYIH